MMFSILNFCRALAPCINDELRVHCSFVEKIKVLRV